jgi:hypothetical protein
MGTPSKRGRLHNAAHYTETSGDRKLTPGPWRWKTHQFNYGEPEYDYLYSIVDGDEQVLGSTWTDNPIAVDVPREPKARRAPLVAYSACISERLFTQPRRR